MSAKTDGLGNLLSRRTFVKTAVVGGTVVALAASGCAVEPGAPMGGDGGMEGAAGNPDADKAEPSVAEPAQVGGSESAPAADAPAYEPLFPSHEPLGRGRGVRPGRVAWVRDGSLVSWDGEGYWWESGNFDDERVLAALREAVCLVAGEDAPDAAWAALFAHHNREKGRQGGYGPGQRIAVKCNMNGAGTYGDDAQSSLSYTAPSALWALLKTLVEDAGVSPDCITAADPCRIFPTEVMEACTGGDLSGVRFSHYEPGSERDAVAGASAPIRWSGDVGGAPSFAPTCFAEADYVVNLASLKGHEWGITLCAKNHYGTVMNDDRLRPPQAAGLHPFVSSPSMDAYNALVDLLGNEHLDGKCVLWLLEALIVSENNAVPVTREGSLWEGHPFNGGFTASLLASQDPVALDSVGADILVGQPAVMERNPVLAGKRAVEAYLHEAALADAAPSGTRYQDGGGNALGSLGAHEHWNNPRAMEYSRNRGKDEGIELVTSFR